jgi:Sec-independent protein translocase protein TatA
MSGVLPMPALGTQEWLILAVIGVVLIGVPIAIYLIARKLRR